MIRLLLLLLLVIGALPPLGAEPPRVLRLVQWSDIHAGGRHFEPQVWAQARQEGLELKPDALLLTGDQGDNSHDRAGFAGRLREFMATFDPSVKPLLITLGNDDLAVNYQSDPELLSETRQVFQDTLGERYYLDELGNGVFPERLGGLTWISLNSVIFSVYNRAPAAPEQARATFGWLESQLRGGPVVLLCHIPPAWDLYWRKPAWRPEHLRRLRDILLAYPDSVTILTGHFHRNHVQGYRRPQGDVPVLTAASLSDKFGYQPNWRSYEWTLGPRGPERIDYLLRYPGHPEWTRPWSLEPGRLAEFRQRLETDGEFFQAYMTDLYGHHRDLPEMAAGPEVREAVLAEFWVEP